MFYLSTNHIIPLHNPGRNNNCPPSRLPSDLMKLPKWIWPKSKVLSKPIWFPTPGSISPWSLTKSSYPVSMAEITNESFKPANQMMAKCNPRHGKYLLTPLPQQSDSQRLLRCHPEDNPVCGLVPHRVHCRHQLPAPHRHPRDDLAKVQRAVCMLSKPTANAEAWARLDHKFDLF